MPNLFPTVFTKGLEEETFIGDPRQSPKPLAAELRAMLGDGFDMEPDARNIEYKTTASRSYCNLIRELVLHRTELRAALRRINPSFTIIPGAALSLGDSSFFFRSNPQNEYHSVIEKRYGTRVVTASSHMNLGVEDSSLLFRAWRVLRFEAAIFLALSVSSPFLDGAVTGAKSTRWKLFPNTPSVVPLFKDSSEYTSWFREQLEQKEMFNKRHFWTAIRVNGPGVPHNIDRLELRICDRIDDPALMAALMALFEARVQQLQAIPELDIPTNDGKLCFDTLIKANEAAASSDGIDAVVWRWDFGGYTSLAEWIEQYVNGVLEYCTERQRELIQPIFTVLSEGTPAQKWLGQYVSGMEIPDIIAEAAKEAELRDIQFLRALDSQNNQTIQAACAGEIDKEIRPAL